MRAFFNKLFIVFGYIFGLFLILFGIIPGFLLGQNNAGGIVMILYGIILVVLISIRKNFNEIKLVKYIKIAVSSLLVCCFFVAAIISCFMIKYGFFNYPDPDENGTLVILGCRVYDDRPSIMLKNRLDGAIEYLDKNDKCKIVVCGGQGNDEQYSESYVMAKYLVEHGIEQDRIILESKSTSTDENIRFAAEIISDKDLCENMIVVSDSFHLYRASLYAKENGVSIKCVRGKEYIPLFPSYWVREVLGVLYMIVFE